jgi:predicted HTH transcriptional regulator
MHTLTIDEVPEGLPPNLSKDLSEDELKVCRLIYKNNSITLSEMAEQSGFSKSKAHRITVSLTERNIIMRVGSQKNGTWRFL